ncbi:hypothetical protein JTT01_00175 [Clostridium botulinum]|nr:hypothetical protein [Clostridium botulinum]
MTAVGIEFEDEGIIYCNSHGFCQKIVYLIEEKSI